MSSDWTPDEMAEESASGGIGGRIRTARMKRGFTQKQLAEIAGIPAITLQQYERGVTKQPRIEQLARIATALDCSVDDFLCDADGDGASNPSLSWQKQIADVLLVARENAGLTQEQLAAAIGVKRPVISKYETGAIEPSIAQLRKIADALAVPVAYLLDGYSSAKDVEMSIGEKIGALSSAEGINLRQLAIKADVPYNTVYALVKRRSNRVEWETLEKIAAALGYSAQDLRGCAKTRDVSDVDHLFVSVSEIGLLLQNGEIIIETPQQTFHITLAKE